MFNSTQEKPVDHFTRGDWNSYKKNLESVTDKTTVTGNNVRQEAAQLRYSVENTMKWKRMDNNKKLGDRIDEVEQWFRNLDRALVDVKEAIDRLSQAKQEVEKTIAANLLLLEAAKETLNLRDRRRGIDLVEDEAYVEVQQEVELIHKTNTQLREAAKHDWDHLMDLKEQRDILEADLMDKELTTKIDRFQLSLTPSDTHVTSLKPWPADACSAGRCPVSLDTWLQGCEEKRRRAEKSVVKGDRAANDSWNLMRKTNGEIRHKRDATQFAIRKRRHETIQARDALAAQRKDLLLEIERLEREMLDTEQELQQTRGNLKLVQTRMEGRKSRPGMELVRDHPAVGFEEELRHVVESREHLAQKLRDIKNILNRIQNHLREVEDDLQRKERSLAIETASLEVHGTPAKSPYQTDISWLAPVSNTFSKESVSRGFNQRIVDRHLQECADMERSLVD